MSSWSDAFLRSLQIWTFYFSIGFPLLGALIGGVCVLVKGKVDNEVNQRQTVARASRDQTDAGLRQKNEAELRQKTEADLRAQLDQSVSRVKELEAQQNARVITPEQRAKFIEALEFSPKGRVTVNVTSGVDQATIDYANQIHAMVEAAGYDAGAAVDVASGKQPPTGIFMLVGDEKHPFAGALQHAFSDIGIHATGLVDDTIQGDGLRIEVGLKP